MDTEIRDGIRILWGVAAIAAHIRTVLPDWFSPETQVMEIPVDRMDWQVIIPQEEVPFVHAYINASPEVPAMNILLERHRWNFDVPPMIEGLQEMGIGAAIRCPGDPGLVVYWIWKEPRKVLRCSAGHVIDPDTDNLWKRHRHGLKKPGDRCGEEISYERMKGSVYCRRVLKEHETQET